MKTIKGKINIAFSVLMALALISMGFFLFYYFSNFYINNLEKQLIDKGRILAESTSYAELGGQELQRYLVSLGEDSTFRYTMINYDGEVLGESEKPPSAMDNHLDRPEIQTAKDSGVGIHTRYSETMTETLMYAAIPIFDENDEEVVTAYARVAFTMKENKIAKKKFAHHI